MPLTTLAFNGMPSASDISAHAVLSWYVKYAQDFSVNFRTTPFDRYYAADCRFYFPDGTLLQDGARMWEYLGRLYQTFPRVTREVHSFIVVHDDQAQTHVIHARITTTLYLDGEGRETVAVPQYFVYTVGKADEGKGTDGLQFRELRNFYERELIEQAKRSL